MSFSEWKEVKLGDIAKVKGGKRLPKGVNLTKEKNNHPYIRVRDLGNKKNLYLNNDFEYVDVETQKSISRYIVNTGDIVISIVGTIGLVSKINESLNNANLTENCVKLVDLLDVDSDYIYYYLISKKGQNEINKGTVGAVQAKLPIKNIQAINVTLPNFFEQKTIADTLSRLDDKIELNNRINKTLEGMAQAIFKSWFVDFEPFQDGEFEDSELGRIPKGWRIKALYDFAEYINGTSFKKDEYSSSGYPIVKITELKNGITSATQYFSGIKDEKYYIKTGDILFSWSGNPQTSIDTFIWVGSDAILNQHTFKIFIKNNDYSFIYLLLKHFKPEFTRIASSKQTTGLGHVTVSDLKRLKFPHNTQVIEEFCVNLDLLIHMYVNNLLENERLRVIRDTLLPKLMSGEIRIPIEEVQ